MRKIVFNSSIEPIISTFKERALILNNDFRGYFVDAQSGILMNSIFEFDKKKGQILQILMNKKLLVSIS